MAFYSLPLTFTLTLSEGFTFLKVEQREKLYLHFIDAAEPNICSP
jgi:hypothetical protein